MSPDKEVYEKRDILLARMDENLNHIVEWTKQHKIDDDKYQVKTDLVLDDLKKFKWKQMGAIACGLVFIELIIKMVIK